MVPKLILHSRICLLPVILLSFIHAQTQSKVSFGIKAGAVISNLSLRAVDPIARTGKKGSATFGMFVHIPVKGRFSIRPSVEYVSKGAVSENRFNGYNFTRKTQLSYIDIPVNLLHAFPRKTNKWLVGGGPVISFLLNKEVNREFKRNDIGVNVLAGYEWAIGASLVLNFTQGLKNVVAYNANGESIKNYCFGFTIGYWF